MSEKEKQRNGLFLANGRKFFALSHFTFICSFNYQLYKA